ncbi:hypothetical protein V8F20_007614 [Naviculisporaceae sp. PSN 640]
MADNMCGPSNGAKNLVSHADRDRSMYQDRFTSNAQAGGSATFRSNTTFGQGAELGFNNFQQANMPPEMAVNHMLPVGDRTFTPPVPHVAQGPAIGAAPGAFASPMAMGRAADQGWVNEFSAMNLGPSTAHPQTANAAPAAPVQAPWAPPTMGLQAQPGPFFMSQTPVFAPSMMGNSSALSNSQLTATPAQPQMDVEAFNRAFGDYDGMLFEQEVAAWKSKEETQAAADREFEAAQAAWMAVHGPGASEAASEGQAAPPTTQQEENQALKKRFEDEQLARAAVDIVNSVSDNATEKFQKSQFFELMRRIANKEVVVDGENFIDAETGEGLDTTQKDNANNDGDHQLKSAANTRTGAPSRTTDA